MTRIIKSTLSMLLIAVLIVSLIPVSVMASTAPMKISVASKSATPGTTVDVEVAITDNPGVAAVTLNIDYDKDNLTLTGFTYNTDALSGASTTPYNALASTPTLFMVNGSQNVTGDFTFATLSFKVKENAKKGVSAYIRLSYDADNIYNIAETNVPCTVEDGAINIISCIPGDINWDEKVNAKDVSRLMQYHAGWQVEVNQSALDTNGDGKLNSKDISRLMQHIAGWPVDLYPKVDPIANLIAVPAKAPECETDGNIAYWKNEETGKYYKDDKGLIEISLSETIIPATGHTPVIDPAVPATYDHTGLSEGSHCSVCGKTLVEQEIIPVLKTNEYSIVYHLYDDDTYLQKVGITNSNPLTYASEFGLKLSNLKVDGYIFEGWYDGEGANGRLVREIPAGTTGDYELFARWTPREYTIQFDCGTSNQIVEEKSIKYKVSEGKTLPNPEWHGYTFLGWSDDDAQLVTRIMPGTIGNITLHANWTSKRNQTVPVNSLGDPIIVEDKENGIYFFTYEIGRIENIPLYTLHDFGHQGIGITEDYTTSLSGTITQSTAENIAEMVSKTTTKTNAWSLSKEWNNSTAVSSQHLCELGGDYVYTEGDETSSSGGLSLGGNLGGSSTKTKETGTTTNVSGKLSGSLTHEDTTSAKIAGIPLKVGKLDIGKTIKNIFNIGAEASSGREKEKKDTSTQEKYWNVNAAFNVGKASTHNESTTSSLSTKIADQYGYTTAHSEGGSASETESVATSQASSREYSTSVAYSTAQVHSETKTYKTDKAKEGYYRLVAAGTAHVFAVVGYDVSSSSYFVNTYSILDGDVYEFWDYSKNTPGYDDYENGILPFEVPLFVNDYIDERVTVSDGLVINERTGIITGYTGSSKDVIVPDYLAVNNGENISVVQVKGIASGAFANNTNIESIKLGTYVTDIPEGAFTGCSSLESIECPNVKTIGSNAFCDCVSLNTFKINEQVVSLGANAFNNVTRIGVSAINDTVAESAVNSGAKTIVLTNASDIAILSNKTIKIPSSVDSFTFNGAGKQYNGIRIESDANTTILNNFTINTLDKTPLCLSSQNVQLNRLTVYAKDFAIVLSSDNTNVSLYSDVNLNSQNNQAMLCKSINLSKENESVSSILNASGNIMIWGTITGQSLVNLVSGEIIPIGEESFEQLSQGSLEWVLASDVPEGAKIIESKTQYRYADRSKEYKDSKNSSESGWTRNGNPTYGNWSEYTDQKITAKAGIEVDSSHQVCGYYYFDCPKCHTHNQYSTKCTSCGSTAMASNGAAYWVCKWTTNYNCVTYTDSTYGKLWYWSDNNYGSKRTGYRQRTVTYHYWRWGSYGAWSSWSDTVYTSSDSRKIETRTMCRYISV